MLHNAEIHALFSLPDVLKNLKSRLLRWAGYVAGMSYPEMHRDLMGKPKGGRDVHGTITLKWI